LDKLSDAGIDTIVLTGGEPLIRKDIVSIIKSTYTKGFRVYLSTNGIRLMEFYNDVADYISCLGLPMDGSTNEMHIQMSRGPVVFPAVKNVLEYLSKHPSKHIIKIGTVVSAVNRDDILNIGKFLYEDNTFNIDVWRLYQFSPLKEGLKHRNRFEISEDEFNEICEKVKCRFPNKNIIPLSDADSNDAYIFINPKLEIETLSQGQFHVLGNILELSQQDLDTIMHSQNDALYRSNINRRWLSYDRT
jgi:MoaA/NifB/PqqE/SkfB family radical SAM enzyme